MRREVSSGYDDSPGQPVIRSSGNPLIKRARSLLRRKARAEEGAFLVEGCRAVEDILSTGIVPEVVLVDADVAWRPGSGDAGSVNVRRVAADVLATISDVVHSQGVIAVVSHASLPRHTPSRTPELMVIADAIGDPGNLGTLIRSAAGAGATILVTTADTVDPFNPKCVRAAMGGHLRLPVEHVTTAQLAASLEHVALVAVAEAHGRERYDAVDWTRPAAIIIGSEAHGPSIATRALATCTVRIPLANRLESLNAGVAGSLLLFEAARQRDARFHGDNP